MWKEEAIRQIGNAFDPRQGDGLIQCIEAAASFRGSESVFRRMARAKGTEAILDYLAEIRFAMIFVGLRFEPEFEPDGKKGPDLRISRDSRSAQVEVKRFRPSLTDDGPPYFTGVGVALSDPLVPYGNPDKNVKTIADSLAEKLRQLKTDTTIVAFWSDRSIEEVEFEVFMRRAREDCETGALQLPGGLLFSIFGWNWSVGGQQLYCEAFKVLAEPFATWAEELRKVKVSDLLTSCL